MPRFAFEARDAQGRAVRGFESAADLFDLDKRLGQARLLLIDATPAAPRRRRKTSDRGLVDFCYHLSVVVEAGIPLLQGLSDLCEDDAGPLSEAISDVTRKIEAGSTLSEALAERPEEFPPLVRSLIRAGERTGKLDRILKDLVRYLEWREDLRRQVRSATTYPVIVVLGVIGLGAIVTIYVLPSFLGIFMDLGVPLPLTTRALIATDAFLRAHWLPVAGGTAVLAVSLAAWGRTPGGRYSLHGLLLRVPVLGKLVLMVECSRLCHNLGVLYSAGLPILACLEMLRDIVQNLRFREVIEDVEERVGRGETLTDALRRHALMPTVVMRMVSIGETSGRLDDSLERAASFYDREVPQVIARALAIFNTSALVFLGAALVLIGLSLFVPLYSMMGSLDAAP